MQIIFTELWSIELVDYILGLTVNDDNYYFFIILILLLLISMRI